MSYILLLVGFVLLIKGADYFVDGASRIAKALQISPLLIGLTIVSFGTSSPEATVSIVAALEGNAGIALGNVIGSNILNITLVMGITAIISPLTVQNVTFRKEIPFMLLASTVLLIAMNDSFLQGISPAVVSRSEGFILLLFLSIFIYYIIEVARNSKEPQAELTLTEPSSWTKNALYTFGGLGAIILGGELVVNNATTIAYSFGMSETLVGLTIIAIGTSLPELITSITAAVKKESEIAIGNVVGSNIFNILFVLGTTAVVSPLLVDTRMIYDGIIMIIFTALLLIFSRTNYKIGRVEGLVLGVSYLVYLVYIIIRN
ncbi:calcium/sodium antiporter [Bacillus coahuilensis]|uniref:calcium/sodium antiporter n=1 Tax=Bacillus coahuilensis TaxID=408580 RepID=UPI0001851199|nr:calcium/sodium antiporter [Bacillus coahuilensis]